MRVVWTQFDTRLNSAQHYRMCRLHDVAAHQHVVPRLLVQQLEYPRISVDK